METRVAALEYSSYNLVTLQVLSMKENEGSRFVEFLEKLNINKEAETTSLFQFPAFADKSVRDYCYSIQCLPRRDYMHFGKLVDNCFRVMHIIADDFSAPNVFARFRSWVSLIASIREKKIGITFALITDESVTQREIDTKESQMHDLITELSYLFDHIEFGSHPLFIQEARKKETMAALQKQVKSVVDSFPVYLPTPIIEKLLPLISYEKIMRYAEFTSKLQETPGIDVMDASILLQKLVETGVVFRLTEEWVCTDPKWFCRMLTTHLRNSAQNVELRGSFPDSHDGSEIICDESLLEDMAIPDSVNTDEFRTVLSELLARERIWLPLKGNSYFFPSWIGNSVFSDTVSKQNYALLPKLSLNSACFLGRRIIAPVSQCISPVCWYETQALLYSLLASKVGWKAFYARDLVQFTHESNFAFRIYFQMRHGHSKTMRLLELHVAGVTVTGCSMLMQALAGLIHHIFSKYGIDRRVGGFQTKIVKGHDVQKWCPEMLNQNIHLLEVPRIYELMKQGKTAFNDGISFRSLMPDIIEITENSKVNFRVDQNEVFVEITVIDKNNQKHKCLPQDDLQVMLISSLGSKIIGEKFEIPGNEVLAYSCDLGDSEPDVWLLVVTFASKPEPIGNTPVWISENCEEEVFNWKRFWQPARDYLALEICDISDYLASREAYLSQILDERSVDDDTIIRPPRTEEITEAQYLQICVDAVFLSVLAYRKDKKEYVSRHMIQRELNKRKFYFLPDIKQKIKVYYFSPPVSISWYKSGKTCFYTFERGGDLYICIRGTKTGADIIADLQYSLVPYDPSNQLPGRRRRLINRIKKKESDVEMIHNGFSVYADIIIQHFRES